MNDKKPVFDSYLDKKEYLPLWVGSKKLPLCMYLACSVLFLVSAVLFVMQIDFETSSFRSSLWILYLVLCVLSLAGMGFGAYIYFERGGVFVRGTVRIYQDGDVLKIEFSDKDVRSKKVMQVRVKKHVKNHLYLEESKRNYVFLPIEAEKSLLPFVRKED